MRAAPPDIKVLAFSADVRMAEALPAQLRSGGRVSCAGVCRTLGELSAALQGDHPSAAVIDMYPAGARLLHDLEPLIAGNPETRFVLLCEQLSSDLLMGAMQAGARQAIARDSLSGLAAVLEKIASSAVAQKAPEGSAVTLLSTGGGCGSTTLAINLAIELGLAAGKPSLLVDLDVPYGAAAAYLGVRNSYGLADVLEREDGFDPELIRSSAAVWSNHLHVMLSPASINFAAPLEVRYRNLARFMDACRRTYARTVVDAPYVALDVAETLARCSEVTLIVLQLTVKDICIARDLRAALVQRGVDPMTVRMVINRYSPRRTMVELQEARQALGQNHLHTVCNDFGTAVKALNLGKPLAEAAPTSALRKDIRALSVTLVGNRPLRMEKL